MTWEYGLIGLFIGIFIGAVCIYLYNKKVYMQHNIQYELKKTKKALEEYRQKTTNHFSQSAKLMDDMASIYRNLYKHMEKGSNDLLSDILNKRELSIYPSTELDMKKDRTLVKTPLDYSEDISRHLNDEHSIQE